MESSYKNYEQPIQSQQVQSQTQQRQHVAFTQPSTSGRVVFNRSYLLSVAGIFRWLLIVSWFILRITKYTGINLNLIFSSI